MASDRGQRREGQRGRRGTHQSPKCIPGRHGEAVLARPTKRGLGKSSPTAASQHREHPPRMLPPVPLSHQNHRIAHCRYREKICRSIRLGGVGSRRNLSQDWPEISSEVWHLPNPSGGGGRGHWGGHFAPDGGSGSRWRWPGSAGGGGDIGRRRGLGRERGTSERVRVDWVGLTDPDPGLSG
jgi:hypothetical protein